MPTRIVLDEDGDVLVVLCRHEYTSEIDIGTDPRRSDSLDGSAVLKGYAPDGHFSPAASLSESDRGSAQSSFEPEGSDAASEHRGNSASKQANDEDDDDLVLEVLVNSNILCLTSRVFKAMLTGSFHEAKELARTKAESELYVLELPEDHAEATATLFRLMHHENNCILNNYASSELLEEIAYVCDKYLCTHILRHCGSTWARNWMDGNTNGYEDRRAETCCQEWFEELSQTIVFTYVAKIPEEFAKACRLPLMNHPGPVTGHSTLASKLINHPLVPMDVAWHLDKVIRNTFAELRREAAKPIERIWKSTYSGCHRAGNNLREYMRLLRGVKVYPDVGRYPQESISTIISPLKDLQFSAGVSQKCELENCVCMDDVAVGVDNMFRDLASRLDRLDVLSLWLDVVCLDCARNLVQVGGFSWWMGNDPPCVTRHIEMHEPDVWQQKLSYMGRRASSDVQYE